MDSGLCVKTLEGHSSCVWRFQELESGELISCSHDHSIKIWDLKKGSCLKTLIGHTKFVTSIRIIRQNSTLLSCSEDGTIKTWNLGTGKCVNTITASNGGKLFNIIFI